MIEIIKEATNKKFYIDDLSGEETLLELLQENKLVISAPCNGRGECGRCRVRFLAGAPVPTEKERRLLNIDELEEGVRLACVVRVKEGCRVLLPESGEENMAVLARSDTQTPGTVSRSDTQAMEVTSQSDLGVTESVYGIAIDIGTTTLVAELFDLSNGKTIAVTSGVNHQRAYGADVIARIAASNGGKAELLRESIREDVVRLICELKNTVRKEDSTTLDEECRNDAEKPIDIRQIAIVGNTTMCHLLRGLSCEGMGRAPFTPTDNSWYETDAMTLLGLEDCHAKVTILPGISAFVGADIVAGIFASEMDKNSGKSLLLDIGTNGEMVLCHGGKLLVTSTAAGPVFEGGNISCGVPGIPGAISHISIPEEEKRNVAQKKIEGGKTSELSWHCETIGNQPPVGLCGTGIIDFVSVLLEVGYMDENGNLEEPWFTDGVAVDGDAIRFTQSDIREVQMGKAAIRAGIEILLAETSAVQEGVTECEITTREHKTECIDEELLTVYLAGGFGHSIDIKRAIRIGLFPKGFERRITCIGNSALEGAKKYLLSEDGARERIGRIINFAQERNLAEQPGFEELYLTHMSF